MYKKLTQLSDLAYYGAKPLFDELLHVGSPNIGNKDSFFKRLDHMFTERRLTNYGPYVRELETKLSEFLGVKHVIAMTNGTIALEIAIRALDLKGEVIIPSFTFVATAHALQWQEIRPVFCDIDPRTHHIDPGRIAELITPFTTGILGVHLWARTCNIEALEKIAQERKLKLLFDAAHAFGVSHNNRRVGSFGDAEVFSFHATKFFNTFEGGAVATNNDELANKIRLMKNFGFSGMDKVIYIGTNGKMSEVSAAMGLTLLEEIDQLIELNRSNYQQYLKNLDSIPGLRLLPYPEKDSSNYQYIVAEIDEKISGISRDQLMDILHAENVIARRYFYPGCHKMEPYISYQPNAGLLLPETEKSLEKVLTLPTGSAMTTEKINALCNLIQFCFANATNLAEKIK